MKLTINEALNQGIAAHKASRANEADKIYTAILQVQPKHPDANHNLGIIAVSFGKIKESLPFFKTALESNLGVEQYWLSYISAMNHLKFRIMIYIGLAHRKFLLRFVVLVSIPLVQPEDLKTAVFLPLILV